MLIYIARHGQPDTGGVRTGTENDFPKGNPGLTAYGIRQAELLGDYLKRENFHGLVYSSPFNRTLHTAEIVCRICGLTFFPSAELQEFSIYTTMAPSLPLREIAKTFSMLDSASELSDDWKICGTENREDVHMRVRSLLLRLTGDPASRDLLLIGHGASVIAARQFFWNSMNRTDMPAGCLNCEITKLNLQTDGTVDVCACRETSFLLGLLTNNSEYQSGAVSADDFEMEHASE